MNDKIAHNDLINLNNNYFIIKKIFNKKQFEQFGSNTNKVLSIYLQENMLDKVVMTDTKYVFLQSVTDIEIVK